MRLLGLLAIAGCAAPKVCPSGTTLVSVRDAERRAQWCSVTTRTMDVVPSTSRSFEGALSIGQPTGLHGGVEGPFTSWYANGTLESHGTYVNFGSRSVPDGLWGFWRTNGERRTIGMYKRGAPAGCFAVWDEAGNRYTGFVEGTQLRVDPCTPPDDEPLAIIEGRRRETTHAIRADAALQSFVGTGRFGARNADQLDPDPAFRAGFHASARWRFGGVRVGPTGTMRISDNSEYRAFGAGGVVALALPSLHPRIDAEAGIEIGAQYITATARRPQMEQPGTAELDFWSALIAIQLGVGIALSETLEALVGIRVDGAQGRDDVRRVTYCDFQRCYAPRYEQWDVGGLAYGLNLGLRVVFH